MIYCAMTFKEGENWLPFSILFWICCNCLVPTISSDWISQCTEKPACNMPVKTQWAPIIQYRESPDQKTWIFPSRMSNGFQIIATYLFLLLANGSQCCLKCVSHHGKAKTHSKTEKHHIQAKHKTNCSDEAGFSFHGSSFAESNTHLQCINGTSYCRVPLGRLN